MKQFEIIEVGGGGDRGSLAEMFWRVLWEPLGIDRDAVGEFKLEGEPIEFMCKVDGRVIGGVAGYIVSDSEAELRHIAVVEGYQNKGIRRELVKALIEAVRAKGCKRIRTIARNTSAGFFKKLGFNIVVDEQPPSHPIFEKHGISFVIMQKQALNTS
jgi:GNAT superfamily N-acetyltransferase